MRTGTKAMAGEGGELLPFLSYLFEKQHKFIGVH